MTTTKTYDDNGRRICDQPYCGRRHTARGLCSRHLQRTYRHGSPEVLVYGQDGDKPKPCLMCSALIPPRDRRSAPKVCGQRCRSAWQYRRGCLAGIYQRLTEGL